VSETAAGDLEDTLAALSVRIAEIHRQRPTLNSAYYTARYQELSYAVQSGTSITAARELADGKTFLLRESLEDLDGELAALCEERDHLRFCKLGATDFPTPDDVSGNPTSSLDVIPVEEVPATTDIPPAQRPRTKAGARAQAAAQQGSD
jgi:hypothetical protein